MNSHAQIGIIGLGAMGQGLALNIAEKGYRISVFNRHLDGVEENVAQNFVAKSEHRETMAGFDELDSFVQSLAAPRKILLLVSAGAAVDEVIENLTPFLKAGDLIIDGGNSHHRDTERRLQDLETMNIDYLGAGISGGPDGAQQGPAIMVGGTGYEKVSDLLCSIAAQDRLCVAEPANPFTTACQQFCHRKCENKSARLFCHSGLFRPEKHGRGLVHP